MLESLKQAIERKPDYSELALEDSDFQAYWGDKEFKTLICDDDPLLALAGTIESDIPNVSDQHDFYIGQSLLAELRGDE